MDINEELKINMHQPVVIARTEVGDLFDAAIDDLKEKGFIPRNNIYFLMSVAYNFGLVHGKRAERSKKKRGAAVD